MQDQLLDDKEIEFPKDFYPSVWRHLMSIIIDIIFIGMAIGSILWLGSWLGEKTYFLYPLFLGIPLIKCWMEANKGFTLGKEFLEMAIISQKDAYFMTWSQAIKKNSFLWLYFLLLAVLYYLKDITGFDTQNYDKERLVLVFRLSEFLFLYVIGYFIGLSFLLFNPSRRTLFDYIAGTVCINAHYLTASKKPH